MRIERIGAQHFAAVRQSIQPAPVRGKCVRLSVQMKLTEVTGPGAGIMLTTSGSIKTPAVIYQKHVVGTADWQTITVEGKIPSTVSRITLGVMLEGDGTLLVDDVRLEILLSE